MQPPDADDAPPFPADAVEVGAVLGAYGVRGALKVKPHAADPQALFSTRRWFLKLPPAAPATPPRPTFLHVTQARAQGDAVVATCRELADRDAAQALRGATIHVPRTSFPTPGEGEFYWVDLIGLAVVNRAGLPLGRVIGLIDTGPSSVLRIRKPEADAALADDDLPPDAERLIPFVDHYVDEVDLPGRAIRVDWDPSFEA